MINISSLSQSIHEFYNTQDENRRKNLQNLLNQFQEDPNSWRISISLINSYYLPVVQFFSAKNLFTWINTSQKFEIISEKPENFDEIRQFLVQKLTSGAQNLPHSLLNVLSSTLAIFLMKCLPDIWPQPFSELIQLWSVQQQELLLRVLAEVAAEFPRLSIPIKQRGVLRSELARVTPDIVKLAHGVLADSDSSPSLKNAAVECVELWLKLPDAKISDFMNVFTVVFNNIANDTMALARILSTLKANEELKKLPQLVQQITEFIAFSVCPMVLGEINSCLMNKDMNEMRELNSIICAITEFVYGFLSQIILAAVKAMNSSNDQKDVNVYLTLCNFFLQISQLSGIYPTQECISDLPEPFWSTLKDDLLQIDINSSLAQNQQLLTQESIRYFLELIQSTIEKISYFPQVEELCDRTEFEQFEAYRIARSDVSTNAIQIAPQETIQFLFAALEKFLEQQDIYRCEAIFYLISEAADRFKEQHLSIIYPILSRTGISPQQYRKSSNNKDLIRYANSLMNLLQKIEHLLLISNPNRQFLPEIIQIILNFLKLPESDEKALETLVIFMKNRDPIIRTVIDPIIENCFSYFSEEAHQEVVRLNAIRCVGIGLSLKPNSYILNSLDKILLPRLISLKEILHGNSNLTPKQQEEKVLFELSVVAQLVGTLENYKGDDQNSLSLRNNMLGGAPPPTSENTPVRMILNECLPLFNILMDLENPSKELIDKICDVLHAGVISLYTLLEPLLETYLHYLNVLIVYFPAPASELAKTLFLTFRNSKELAPILVTSLSNWFMQYYNTSYNNNGININNNNGRGGGGGGQKNNLKTSSTTNNSTQQQARVGHGDADEHLLELACHIVKKCWPLLVQASIYSEEMAQTTDLFIQSLCWICVKVINTSREISLIKESFRAISLILKSCTSTDNYVLRSALENVAGPLIEAVFNSLHGDLVTSQLNIISDILFAFAKAYSSQTREVISHLPGGDSQLVIALFAQHSSTRTFRVRLSQIHQMALRNQQHSLPPSTAVSS